MNVIKTLSKHYLPLFELLNKIAKKCPKLKRMIYNGILPEQFLLELEFHEENDPKFLNLEEWTLKIAPPE